MRKQIRYFFLFTLFVFSSSILEASEGLNQESLSLDQSLRIAFAQNPLMMEARKEISASKGRWIEAESLPDPEAEIDIGGLKKNASGSRDTGVDRFSVSQPLDPLGTRFLRGRMAHDEVNIAKDSLTLAWGKIAVKVTEVYSEILEQEKAADVAEQNLKTTRQFLTQVETKFQAGNTLQSDLLRAKIESSRAESEFLISQKNLKIAQGELNLLLGREAQTPLALSDVLSYEPLQYQYQKIIEEALDKRADIKIEKSRLSFRKKSFLSAALETVFPKTALGLERTTTDYENDTALLVRLSYPLWGLNLGKVKEAKAEKEKQEIRLDALKKEAGLDVYKTFIEAELAEKQVLLHKKSLDEANELLRQITLSYEEGEMLFLSYLENIKTIKETRLSYFNALKTFKGKVTELERAIQATPIPERIPS